MLSTVEVTAKHDQHITSIYISHKAQHRFSTPCDSVWFLAT